MDITDHILDEHHQQRQMFAELDVVDRNDLSALATLWDGLVKFLEVHAAAEEEAFYPYLLQVGTGGTDAASAEEETMDAIGDHNDIRDAVALAESHRLGSSEWWDAVADARLANSEHMAEEERQGLADLRRHADADVRHQLAVRFVEYVHAHADGVQPENQEPARYVQEHRS